MSSFLKVPRKIHHALLLLTELADRGGKPATVEDIALKGLISPKFLEQVAAPLRNAGLIRGQRGPGGGYVLTKKPRGITVGDILKAVEGPMAVTECLKAGSNCALAGSCTNRGLWLTLQEKLSTTLESVSLADLMTPIRSCRKTHDKGKAKK